MSLSDLMPIRLVTKAAHLQWRVLLLPWTTFLYWLSCCASLLMRFLILTGSPPAEFYSKAKVLALPRLPYEQAFIHRKYLMPQTAVQGVP